MNYTTQTQNRHFACSEALSSVAIYDRNAADFDKRSFGTVNPVCAKRLHIEP